MRIGDKEVDPEAVVNKMIEVGLIQFDELQPDFMFSVYGFGHWGHDQDLVEAVAKSTAALGSFAGLLDQG